MPPGRAGTHPPCPSAHGPSEPGPRSLPPPPQLGVRGGRIGALFTGHRGHLLPPTLPALLSHCSKERGRCSPRPVCLAAWERLGATEKLASPRAGRYRPRATGPALGTSLAVGRGWRPAGVITSVPGQAEAEQALPRGGRWDLSPTHLCTPHCVVVPCGTVKPEPPFPMLCCKDISGRTEARRPTPAPPRTAGPA